MSVDLIFANCRRQAGKEYAPLLAPGPAVCWSLSDYVIDFKKFSGNGVHERIRTSDPRIHTASAFAAALPCWEGRSWSGLSLHHGP